MSVLTGLPHGARGPVAGLLTALALAGCGAAGSYDVLLLNGTVVDGSGLEPVDADVGIRDGYVVAVGDLSGAAAATEVDVAGLFVAPGFVNLHSHDRLATISNAENLLTQGVTTIILNADGGGPLDIAEQLSTAERDGLAINIGANIGFNTAWSTVNGPDDRRPSTAQLAEMRGYIEQGLSDGAWGVSAGLDYKPAYFSTVDEAIEVLEGMGRWRTVFTNHDRLSPESGFSSRVGMEETVAIGEATGLVPIITHMKIQGREQGSAGAVLGMMNAATERGVYTAADAYPYLAGQTSLAALIIPGWAQAGGRDAMVERFADPALRARIVSEANEALDARFGGPSGVFLPATQTELTDIVAEMGARSGGEAVVRILTEDFPGAILRFGADDDLQAILSYPTTSIACDCDASTAEVGHPRGWGTFPRVLGRFVREGGWMTWESAIQKMSALPATTIGMVDRGMIAPGMAADVVVFDPETVMDHADYENPTTPSEGIVHVMVNGRWALRDGAVTGEQAGRALARSAGEGARPMSMGVPRELRVDAAVVAETSGGLVQRMHIDVTHRADGREASGSVQLLGDGGDPVWTATQLGVLQVADGWATLSAVMVRGEGEGEAGEQRAATIIVDRQQSSGSDTSAARVRVRIAGEDVLDAGLDGDVSISGVP